MTYFYRAFLFLIFLFLGISIDTLCPAQAGWLQKIQDADLEQLNLLKVSCSLMLARKDNSVKTEKRWTHRLKLIAQREEALRTESGATHKESLNSNLKSTVQAKEQKNETVALEKKLTDEWAANLEFLSSKDLNFLQAHCLKKMSEYEDMLPEGKIWSTRLNQLETFQKSLKKRRLGQNKQKGVEPQKELLGDAPYSIGFIYVNPKNPTVLDLHGVQSASVAQKKVEDFISAAKSKRKASVKVITGKGNHINSKGQQGVLFKSFPNWIAANASVKSYKVSKEGAVTLFFFILLQKQDVMNLFYLSII